MKRVVRVLVLLCVGVAIGWGLNYARARHSNNPPGEAALSRTIPVVRFRDVPLERAIREFEHIAGVPIVVDWPALERVTFPATRLVSERRFGTTLKAAIEQLFGDNGIAVVADGDHITISTWDRANVPVVVRTYDVANLLRPGSLLDDMPGGPTIICFPPAPPPPGTPPPPPPDPRSIRQSQLCDLVRESVDPDSWMQNGGSVGFVHVVGNRLIVGQTSANHRMLADLLRQIREDEEGHADWPGEPRPDKNAVALAALLARTADTLGIDEPSAEDALRRIEDAFQVNLTISDDIDLILRETRRVVIHKPHASLDEALRAWAAQASTAPADVRFRCEAPSDIIITSAKALDETVTLVYDVRKVLARNADPGKTAAEASMELIDAIKEQIDPDSWRENGGSLGVMREWLRGRLVVTQTPENHAKLRAWLTQRLSNPAKHATTTTRAEQ